MGYSAQIAIPLLLLVVLCIPQDAVSQISPVQNAFTMEQVMKGFVNNVAQTQAFTSSQLSDMAAITDSFVGSVDRMEKSGKTSKSMLQAMNMGFASSMAEIAASEKGGAPLSQKTNAILDSLRNSFVEVVGFAPMGFINEIGQLISMFSQVSMNDVSASASSTAQASAGQYQQQQYQQSLSSASQYGNVYTQAAGSGNFFLLF